MPGLSPIRILFYPHSVRALSSSLIGHLAELCQEFHVVLVTERLAAGYARLLEDRTRFPGLEHVEVIAAFGYSPAQLIRGNRRWHQLARDLVRHNRPDVVITENDMSSLFDMYLLRAAKQQGAVCLTIQGMMQQQDRAIQRFIELIHVGSDGTGPGLRRQLRLGYFCTRKWLGHLLVHYLLPWSIGERALVGRSSYVLRTGASGLRDSDLNLVQSHQAFRSHTASGVSAGRLAILPHPLTRLPHDLFFVPADARPSSGPPSGGKTILVLLTSVQVGFRADDYTLINRDQRRQTRLEILQLLHRVLPEWLIVLKPHPDCGRLETVQEYFSAVRDYVTILPPEIPVEPHLQHSDIILDLPLSVTTTLYTAICAYPDKPVISANVTGEFYGDYYRDFPEIDYVQSMPELETLLQRIKTGAYRKAAMTAIPPGLKSFPTTNAAVHHLLQNGN